MVGLSLVSVNCRYDRRTRDKEAIINRIKIPPTIPHDLTRYEVSTWT